MQGLMGWMMREKMGQSSRSSPEIPLWKIVCLEVCVCVGGRFKVRAIRIKMTEKCHAKNSQVLPSSASPPFQLTTRYSLFTGRDGSTEITALLQKDPAEYMWTYIAMYNLISSLITHSNTHSATRAPQPDSFQISLSSRHLQTLWDIFLAFCRVVCLTSTVCYT